MKLSIIARIGVIGLTWSRYLQKQLLPHGITVKQVYLLKRLKRGDFLYPAEIAEILFCDRPTATVVIRNLEKKGWVSKLPDPDNGKRVRISITTAGAAMVQKVTASGYLGDKEFDPQSVLTPEETITLEQLLIKVQRALEKR